jgi:Beta-galactosidase
MRAVARLTLMLLAASSFAAAQSTDIRGIYLYTNDVSQITAGTTNALTTSLNVTGVDGIAIVVGWDAIEPSMGQFQWALLDQWIHTAISGGKKIDLAVPAGDSTPPWLFQPAPVGAGATPLNFTVSPHAGSTGVCQSETIAAPWDSAFLGQWDAMLGALSAHLKSAGTYNAITLVRITGINRTTEELRLPAETAASTGLACVSNSLQTWQAAGYRPSLLLQGWNAVVGSFTKSFPDKTFVVSIIPNDAFPGINESGLLITG